MKKRALYARGVLSFVLHSLFLSIFVVFGCNSSQSSQAPNSVDAEALLPFAAMYHVDREQYCLTELDKGSEIEIRRTDTRTRGYDVVLHMHSDRMSRSVFFVWENNQYIWIGEQEIHRSGQNYTSLDGELPEEITITYNERRTESGPVGLTIMYFGNDGSLPPILTCEQASRYIKEWNVRRTVNGNE